jgi:hypothetical protein
MRLTLVVDLEDSVETQAVEPVVPDPHLRVLERPLAHAVLGEVHRRAPGRLDVVAVVRAEGGERLVPRPEVVVDDVEDHAEAGFVRRSDEAREAVRPAVR